MLLISCEASNVYTKKLIDGNSKYLLACEASNYLNVLRSK